MALSGRLARYALPLPWAIQRGSERVSLRRGLILQLCTVQPCNGSGPSSFSGFGEAACWPGFGSGSLAAVEEALERALPVFSELPWEERAPLRDRVIECIEALKLRLGALPAEAESAISAALLDLGAREQERPLARALSTAAPLQVESHQLVADQDGARRAVAAGARALKVKVARHPLAEERALIEGIRAAVGPEVGLRLDANEGWSFSEAREALEALAPSSPEWIEAPFPVTGAAGIDTLAALRRWSPVPIGADESLRDLAAVEAHLRAEAADVYVLKPLFLRGALPVWAMAERIAGAGARLCLTHGLGTQIERRGVAHLAAALIGAGIPVAGGLGGTLAEDVAEALPAARGCLSLGTEAGIGCDPLLSGVGALSALERDPVLHARAHRDAPRERPR